MEGKKEMSLLNERDLILAQWLDDQLDDKALDKLKRHPDFAILEEIARESRHLRAPKIVPSEMLAQFKSSRQHKKTIFRQYRTAWAVAASLLVLVASYLLFIQGPNSTSTLTASPATVVTSALPDQSSVVLNADSRIQYNAGQFDENRMISLVGEAFFSVKEGSNFVVMTDLGRVEVLGTEFNVFVRDQAFEVFCSSGRVRVTPSGGKSYELSPGMFYSDHNGIQDIRRIDPEERITAWTEGESNFYAQPLSRVFGELSRQFDVQFAIEGIDMQQKLTTHFTHDDLDKALQLVLLPLDLDYNKNETLIVVTRRQIEVE